MYRVENLRDISRHSSLARAVQNKKKLPRFEYLKCDQLANS